MPPRPLRREEDLRSADQMWPADRPPATFRFLHRDSRCRLFPPRRDFSANSMRRDMAAPAASLSSRIDRGGRDKIGPAERAASAGEAAMSAAMINVGLMRESRVPIRNVTAHAYDCVSVVATGPRLAGSPLVAYRLRPRPRSHLPTSMATLHKAHQDIHSVAGSCPAAKSDSSKGDH